MPVIGLVIREIEFGEIKNSLVKAIAAWLVIRRFELRY